MTAPGYGMAAGPRKLPDGRGAQLCQKVNCCLSYYARELHSRHTFRRDLAAVRIGPQTWVGVIRGRRSNAMFPPASRLTYLKYEDSECWYGDRVG